ncbi:MAG: DUF1499 domain-containing protein [Chloroflexota bacterium]
MQIILYIIGAIMGLGVLQAFIGYRRAQTIPRPDDAGNGSIKPCPQTPNCVSTVDTDKEHGMETIPYAMSLEEAKQKLLGIIAQLPRAIVVNEADTHIYVETRSPTMGFPDDVEFVFDDDAKVIHFRSAARMGMGDLGKNRERMAYIRDEFSKS